MKRTYNYLSCAWARGRCTALLWLLMLPLALMAQNVETSGKVTDAKTGEEIIGATVKVKGATGGVITDYNGDFKITCSQGATLEVSYVGYKTKRLQARAGQVSVTLEEDVNMLEQVVVVGYGVMKRSDLTGSVSSIDEKAIKQGVNTNIEQAMQGRIAGVAVTQNSGAPGGGISVQIRGINSLNGNEPLYVIDGIAVSGQTDGNSSALSSLNPSDIVSLEVLKDASATAIYGSRASNGVVLITTKRGQNGKPKLSYEGYVGWQQLPSTLKVMNLEQYAEYHTIRAKLMGWGESYEYRDPSLFTEGTDWQDVLFRTAFMHNHQVGINGGTEEMHYALSAGYLNQDGIAIGSGFERISARVNFDTNIAKWLQVGVNGYFANTDRTVTFEESGAISTALNQYPDVAPYNPDGTLGFGETHDYQYQSNPLFEASMKDNWRKNNELNYNVFANITPVNGLTLRVEYGGSRSWGNNLYFTPAYSYGNVVVASELTKTETRNTYESFKQYLTYDVDPLRGHHLQVMAGHESQEGSWGNISAGRNGYISTAVKSLAVGDAATSSNGEQGAEWAIESYYGRLNYNMLDRYLLTATLRADGSSNFDNGSKWGWFPSAALAWRVSQEKFMENVKWVDNLKLRLGWGHVGNQSTPGYAYGVAMANVATAWGTGYYPANFPNSGLKWESTNAWNVGLDMNFLGGRIEFIVDAYLKNTDNLLLEAALPMYLVPSESWNGMTPQWENTGSIRNKGIEFTLNTVNIKTKDLEWRTGATLSINRNKVTKLPETIAANGTFGGNGVESVVGHPMYSQVGYVYDGIFKSQDEIDNHAVQNGAGLGRIRWKDLNNDGVINEADQEWIYDPTPDFTWGLNIYLQYKNFDFTMFWQGVQGVDVISDLKKETDLWSGLNISNLNKGRRLLDAWTPSNNGSNIPAISTMDNNNEKRVSTYFVENGSFAKLRTIQFGYNIPKTICEKLYAERLRLYLSAQNLLTIKSKNFTGVDPENANYGYPIPLNITFGLNVSF